MLRITPACESKQVLKIEGQLSGPWVGELAEACSSRLERGARVELDLSDVTFADRAGVNLLIDLLNRGAALHGCSPFLSRQLNESSSRPTEGIT